MEISGAMNNYENNYFLSSSMEDTQRSDLLGQRQVRLEKLAELKKLVLNPYPAKSYRDHTNGDILEKFEEFDEKKCV
jgi:lysyl-tRNA synthetase class II